jgi:hypothetical protein
VGASVAKKASAGGLPSARQASKPSEVGSSLRSSAKCMHCIWHAKRGSPGQILSFGVIISYQLLTRPLAEHYLVLSFLTNLHLMQQQVSVDRPHSSVAECAAVHYFIRTLNYGASNVILFAPRVVHITHALCADVRMQDSHGAATTFCASQRRRLCHHCQKYAAPYHRAIIGSCHRQLLHSWSGRQSHIAHKRRCVSEAFLRIYAGASFWNSCSASLFPVCPFFCREARGICTQSAP